MARVHNIGFHMTIDGIVRRMPTETDIRTLLQEMPAKISMRVLYGPHVVKGNKNNPGLTGFVIIDTSHISVHTFGKERKVSLDVFSCRPFGKDKALACAMERIAFVPKTMNVKFMERKTQEK